jgi:hypothetical protein
MGPNRIVASAPYFPKGSHAVVVAVINNQTAFGTKAMQYIQYLPAKKLRGLQ